ncbi:MAG: hypothetical protein HXK63_00030 [Campylobacter sp.]|nr:hypothetical protein [Campylobacter sp.]
MLSKISYMALAQIFFAFTSVVSILVLPKLLSLESFGYYQLFIFFANYVELLHFGLSDGIYLRYGGRRFESILKRTLKSQIYAMEILYALECLIIFFAVYTFSFDKRLFLYIAISGAITVPRSFLYNLLQSINEIKKSIVVLLIERIFVLSSIAIVYFVDFDKARFLIFSFIFARFISFAYICFLCRDVFKAKTTPFVKSLFYIFKNMRIGIRLTISTLCNIFLIFIARSMIAWKFSVIVFGKISLVLSLLNFALFFINAFSAILFPILRNKSANEQNEIFKILDDGLSAIFIFLFLFAYPMQILLALWLPKYADALHYMPIIFAIFLCEGKTLLLTNSYFKALRKERQMLRVNLIILTLFSIFIMLAVVVSDDLFIIMFCLFLSLFLKYVALSRELAKFINSVNFYNIGTDFFCSVCFVFLSRAAGEAYSFCLAAAMFIFLFALKRKNLIRLFRFANTAEFK